MEVSSAAVSGYQLINQSFQKAESAGQAIAQAPVSNTQAETTALANKSVQAAQPAQSLEMSAVTLLEAERGAQAGVKVVAAADERIGTLIDIKV